MKQLYTDPEELQGMVDKYVLAQEAKEKPLTYTGLAFFLGFASRQSLWEYSKRKDNLSLPIKRAMLRIEQSYEENLTSGNSTGSIFALKNRGWTDKQELQHTTKDNEGNSIGILNRLSGAYDEAGKDSNI